MRGTSILAYRSLSPSDLNNRQSQVLEALEEMGVASNRELSEKTKLPINVVTPRCQELRKKGHVGVAYEDRDSLTGRMVTFWKPVEV